MWHKSKSSGAAAKPRSGAPAATDPAPAAGPTLAATGPAPAAEPAPIQGMPIPTKLRGPVDFGFRVFMKCTQEKVGACAAQIGFFTLMSAFPFVILFMQLIRIAPVSQESILFLVDSTFPSYILTTVHGILQEVYSTSFGLVPLTIITMLWTTSKVMHAMAAGLDALCTTERPRNWFVVRGWSLLCTLLLAFVLVLIAGTVVVWRPFRTLLIRYRPPGVSLSGYSNFTRSIYTIVVGTLALTVLYKVLPRRHLRFTDQLPGAFLGMLGVYFFSIFVAVYVDKFNGFSAYGSLTILTLIMFWLYFSSYIVMIGAAVNEVMREDRLAAAARAEEACPAPAHQEAESPGL